MKQQNLDRIRYKNLISPSKKYEKIKDIFGFDTETYNGEAFLISFWGNRGQSFKTLYSFDDFLSFLSQHRKILKKKSSYMFFYNLSYDQDAIIKLLPPEVREALATNHKGFYKGVLIRSISGKFFSVSFHNDCYRFFDISQFYGKMSLCRASQKHLGLDKLDVDASKIDKTRYDNDNIYRKTIIDYCVQDSKLCCLLAQKLYDNITPFLKPRYFYSQASFSQQYFLENLKHSQKLPNRSVLQYALNCYQGGRFEVFKRGLFDKAYQYDINSAYPYHNVLLPDVSKGKWSFVKENVQAQIAIYRCRVYHPQGVISPLKWDHDNKVLLYPSGSMETYLTQQELDLAKSYGTEIKIIDGWAWKDPDPVYPYTFLKDFFEIKRTSKGFMRQVSKIIMNGFYGKNIQLNKTKIDCNKKTADDYRIIKKGEFARIQWIRTGYKAGVLFNPIIANEITARTRCQLLEAVKGHEKDVIAFATDSVISQKPLSLPLSDRLGEWKDERADKTDNRLIIIGSGVYSFPDKNHFRGFSKGIDLFDKFWVKQDGSTVTLSVKRRNGLKQSNRLKDWSLYNVIRNDERDINLNFDHKRVWERPFNNINDVLSGRIINSETIHIET